MNVKRLRFTFRIGEIWGIPFKNACYTHYLSTIFPVHLSKTYLETISICYCLFFFIVIYFIKFSAVLINSLFY